jgi:hypothetical protein
MASYQVITSKRMKEVKRTDKRHMEAISMILPLKLNLAQSRQTLHGCADM